MKRKHSIIYALCTFSVIALTILNLSGKGYKRLDAPGITNSRYVDSTGTFHEIYKTDKISLTKGKYKFIINYTTSVDARIEAYVGRDLIAEGVLKKNPNCGYCVMPLELDISTSEFYFKITDPQELNIYNYEISKNGYIIYDDFYYSVLILLFSIFTYVVLNNFLLNKIDVKKLTVIFSLSAIVIFVSSPVFNEYLIYGFDIEFHLSRIEGIKDALLDGQLIPTIYPNCNNGYGVLGIMYPSLFLLPSALLRLCDISMIAAYHFLVLLINSLTVSIAWIASRSFTKSAKLSLICVLLCACNPLRLTSLYQSAAIGATLGMAFMPLVFAGIYEVIYGNKKKWYYITIAFTGILMSHVLSCIIVAVIVIAAVSMSVKEIFNKKEKRYIQFIIAISAFLILNLWYIVRFVIYFRYSLNNDFIFSDHYYKDTIIPTKLFMMSTANMVPPQAEKGILDGCTQSMGIAGLFCLFVVILDTIIPDVQETKRKKWLGINLGIFLYAVYAGTSAFPWYKVTQISFLNSLMGTIQFPHRFYTEISPIILIMAPISIGKLSERQNEFIKTNKSCLTSYLYIIVLFSIISSYTVMDTYNVQIPFKNVFSGGYASYPLIEYLPKNTDTTMFDNITPHNFGSETLSYHQDGTDAIIECKTYDDGAYVLLPMLYYPNYAAFREDGTEYKIGKCPDGRIQIFMPVTREVQKIYVCYSG